MLVACGLWLARSLHHRHCHLHSAARHRRTHAEATELVLVCVVCSWCCDVERADRVLAPSICCALCSVRSLAVVLTWGTVGITRTTTGAARRRSAFWQWHHYLWPWCVKFGSPGTSKRTKADCAFFWCFAPCVCVRLNGGPEWVERQTRMGGTRGWQDHNTPPHMRWRRTPGGPKNCQAKTQ